MTPLEIADKIFSEKFGNVDALYLKFSSLRYRQAMAPLFNVNSIPELQIAFQAFEIQSGISADIEARIMFELDKWIERTSTELSPEDMSTTIELIRNLIHEHYVATFAIFDKEFPCLLRFRNCQGDTFSNPALMRTIQFLNNSILPADKLTSYTIMRDYITKEEIDTSFEVVLPVKISLPGLIDFRTGALQEMVAKEGDISMVYAIEYPKPVLVADCLQSKRLYEENGIKTTIVQPFMSFISAGIFIDPGYDEELCDIPPDCWSEMIFGRMELQEDSSESIAE